MAYCSAELILSASLLTAMLQETSALLWIRDKIRKVALPEPEPEPEFMCMLSM